MVQLYMLFQGIQWIQRIRGFDFSGGIGDLERIETWLLDEGAQIDILINNAGIICYESLLEISREQIDQVFSTNVFDTFLLSRLIANMMIRDKRKGIIINTLSFAATIPSVGSGFYGASKAALVSLTKTMAAEWAPYGIRVNGYSPGVIETKMTESALESHRDTLKNAIALHSIGNASDVIGAVSFLASDESKYITGINLDVSGGKFIVQNSEMAWRNK